MKVDYQFSCLKPNEAAELTKFGSDVSSESWDAFCEAVKAFSLRAGRAGFAVIAKLNKLGEGYVVTFSRVQV